MVVGAWPAAVAQELVPDPLTVIEQDLGRVPSNSANSADSDFGRRANAATNFALAVQLEGRGQFTSALAKYRLAAAADPSYLPTHIRIAIIHCKLDQLPRATAFLREKETSFPAAAEIKTLLAWLYQRQGQPDKALASALAAEKLNPRQVAVYHLLARHYLDQRQRAEIPPLMARSLAVTTDQAVYYARLGDLWAQVLARTEPLTVKEIAAQVLPFYEKARVLNPAHPQLALRLGQLQFDLENYQAAISYYEQAHHKTADLPGLRERMSICYYVLKQPDKNIAVLESLLEDYPDRKNLYPMIAELHGNQNQWAQAAAYYQLYVRLGNPDARDYFRLADAQARDHQPALALATLQQAEKKFPAVTILKLSQAHILRNLERWDEALAIFTDLEQQNDKLIDINFYFDYAVTCDRSGNLTKAVGLFKKCLDLNPNHHPALNYLGYHWASRGENLDEAEQLILRALALDPASPAYLDSMAWVCYQKKEYPKALEYQQKAIAGEPDDPEILEHLADIYYKLGDTEKAIAAWSKASAQLKDPAPLKVKIESAREQLQVKLSP
jgi:tetratricopeptide (TPR) repeat protein